MATNHEPRTCPCKRLPLCLSSFTAAEYGDLHTLKKMGSAVAGKRDEAGYTPLHLAAQNGHVAITSLLLQLGCHVDGGNGGRFTPLHRAAFSGSVATIRIILAWEALPCDLLARDTSFGDRMTPLHKAAGGGRYMAVQLLLEALRNRSIYSSAVSSDNLSSNSGSNSGFNGRQSSLELGLKSKDSMGRTPLVVAIDLSKNQEEERESVARWDAVAGGVADWQKCTQLLRAAEEEVISQQEGPSAKSQKTADAMKPKLFQPLPAHLVTADACFDCGADSDGVCLTSSWEKAFQAVLSNSVQLALTTQSDSRGAGRDEATSSPVVNVPTSTAESSSSCPAQNSEMPNANYQMPESPSRKQVGLHCALCSKACIALYHGAEGLLVCKSCIRRPG
jgi:hypothetical protein